MDRPRSESPHKKSLNRTTGPSDQWQIRSVSPFRSQPNQFSTSDSHPSFRPLVPNPLPSLAPNFGNQRFFTPRSSYFGQQNDNYVFASSSVTNMNPNYNYGQNYANNDYNMGPTRPYSSYESMEANRPVFSTDLSNININIEDLNQLKKALINANQTNESENRKNSPDSPESTNTCDNPSDPSQPSSTPNSMNHLIDEMKKLTEEQNKIKKTRRDVDKKISDLDEELKAYEKKFNLRESLKKCKIDFEKEEEELDNKMRKVISQMDEINKNHNFSLNLLSRDSTPSPVITHSEVEVSKSPKKEVNKSNPTPVLNPVLKRPNQSILKTNGTKKVRISSDVVDSSGLSSKINISSPIKTTPKVSAKPVYRRTPIPSKLGLNSKPTPGTNSPKINRICRQEAQNATQIGVTSGVTSGVRTSRPVKLMTSRNKRLETCEETTKSTPIKEWTQISQSLDKTSVTSEKCGSTSTQNESDNQMIKQLKKMRETDSSIQKDISGQTEATIDPKEKINDRVEEQSPQTNHFNDKQNNVEMDSTNTQKDIQMITIDSEDEDIAEQEEQRIVVKSEKPDSVVDSQQMKRIREETKINRICKQEPQNLTQISVTSGVRTSEPVKLKSSRNKRLETCEETTEETTQSTPIKKEKETIDSTPIEEQKETIESTPIKEEKIS